MANIRIERDCFVTVDGKKYMTVWTRDAIGALFQLYDADTMKYCAEGRTELEALENLRKIKEYRNAY